MKIGDLVKHKNTSYVALVVCLPHNTSNYSMIDVMTTVGPGHWRYSSCEVVYEFRNETSNQNLV